MSIHCDSGHSVPSGPCATKNKNRVRDRHSRVLLLPRDERGAGEQKTVFRSLYWE